MTKSKNKVFGVFLAGLMTVSAVGTPAAMNKLGMSEPPAIVQTITADAAEGRLFNQNAKQWQSKRYYYGRTSDTLYSAGCGIFALGNAIYALNGNQVNIDAMATWGARNGYWRPGSGGTVRGTFYKNASAVYGGTYGFKETGEYWGNIWNKNLINGLQNGKVAVAHVSNHFIAITGYNARNQTYHVIESAVYTGRGLSGDSWVSASKLNSGKTKVDWFCLLENNQSGRYFPRYTGNSSSIVIGLQSVGANSSFNYRAQIYRKNGFLDTYRGTAWQNTVLLNLLKQGRLLKP